LKYDDLRRSTALEQLTDSLTNFVAALIDVIRSKEATEREKDRAVLSILRQFLEHSRKKEPDDRGIELYYSPFLSLRNWAGGGLVLRPA
jgi:hypothetical protein